MAILHNEKGAVLITALVILALLTIIGIAATNTSMLETMISATEKNRTEAFYAAEAGIAHLRRNLKSLYVEHNKNNAPAAQNWDFALAGPVDTDPDTGPATGRTYQTGALWIKEGDLSGNYLYDVTVWNNDDGGTATTDLDKTIYMRADAQVPGGGSASIEIMLLGFLTDVSTINDYGAQEGGGAGKNYNSSDTGAVDTTRTLIP